MRFHHERCPYGTAKAKSRGHSTPSCSALPHSAAASISPPQHRDQAGQVRQDDRKAHKICSLCSPRMSKLRLWLGVHLCQLSGAAAALRTSPAASRARSPNLLFLPHHRSSPRASYSSSTQAESEKVHTQQPSDVQWHLQGQLQVPHSAPRPPALPSTHPAAVPRGAFRHPTASPLPQQHRVTAPTGRVFLQGTLRKTLMCHRDSFQICRGTNFSTYRKSQSCSL